MYGLNMRLPREPTGIEDTLASFEAAADIQSSEVQTLVERLERLQAQIETLNSVLREVIDGAHVFRRPAHRRRISVAAEQARFRKQARKLAQYAPS
jgi:archaellum component FlaC